MLRPNTINGFLFYVKPPTIDYVARELAGGAEKSIRIANGLGGYYEMASDDRFVVLAADCNQGKHGGDELVIASFSLEKKAFVSFDFLPPQYLFHGVSGPANPNWLWIKNGGQVGGYAKDPGGQIGRVTFLSTGEIEWTTTERNTAGMGIAYKRWRRTFSPANGEMGPIREIEPDFKVNTEIPEEPEWF